MEFILRPGQLRYQDLLLLLDENIKIVLDPAAHNTIAQAQHCVSKVVEQNKVVYGINTGFGALAKTRIEPHQLQQLQHHLILSHAAGTGELLADHIVRLIMILKINSLSRGYSGVSLETISLLLALLNANIYPCIPEKGSVGASGDLAPLAHLSAPLIGVGHLRHHGKIISAPEALQRVQHKPLRLGPKEGLALLNGTQVSTALALSAFMRSDTLFTTAIIAGAMSVDALRGSKVPFDQRISQVRGFTAQEKVASALWQLLMHSEIIDSHQDCAKVQDPYSLRCQPQVLGACLAQLWYSQSILLTEANAVSDNPLIFTNEQTILSGGNFHAEPVAFAADAMAVALAEISALADRRMALLVDPTFSHLPAFLVAQPGLNSGFMVAQVSATALASENKCLAYPASIDSSPTCANQEDHVSMATYAARRLHNMVDNLQAILGIELLAAAQGIDLLRPLRSSPILEKVHAVIRKRIPFYEQDRYFAPDIATVNALIAEGEIAHLYTEKFFT